MRNYIMDINDQIINAATKIGILTCKNNKISIPS